MSESWKQYPQQAPHVPGPRSAAPQNTYPHQNGSNSQGSNYQQAVGPSPGGYPQLGANAPQNGYPPYGGYPPQYGHPSQAGHQQQPAYQQAGYSHPHNGYPQPGGYTQLQGYQQQHGYPVQQGGYPPQTGYSHQGYSQYPQPHYAPVQAQYPHANPGPQGYPTHQAYPPPTKVAQPSPSTCYNCGDPGHWAQNCPEPRREFPHGQTSQNRGAKRPNYVPPVITRYSLPPAAASASPQIVAPSPTGSAGYFPPNAPYGSAPSSAQSPQQPQYPQWQGQQPQHQQGYAGQYNQAVAYSPSQQPHGPYQNLAYGSHPPPFTPVQSMVQPYGGQVEQSPGPQSQHMSQRGSLDQSEEMNTSSETEDDEDLPLELLDIPDLPQTRDNIVARPPQPVRFPVEAVADAAELEPLLLPALTSDGKVQSKYIAQNQDRISLNVKETDEFDQLRDDPIFRIIKSPSHSPEPAPQAEPPSTCPQEETSSIDTAPEPERTSTPVYKPEYHTKTDTDGGFDPFDPTAGHFEHPDDMQQKKLEQQQQQQPKPVPRYPYPPPPPPGPPPPPRYLTQARPLPLSDLQRRHSGQESHYPSNGNGHNGHLSSSASPTDDRAEHRKRKYPSDDDGRQYDDVTPKLKRNQPKVDEAYGRRW